MKTNLNVLLATQSKYRSRLTEREITRKYETTRIHLLSSGQSVLDHLKKSRYDVVIVDTDLDGFKGLDILKHIREKLIMQPVIVLVPRDSKQKITNKTESKDIRFLVMDDSFPESLPTMIEELLSLKRPKRKNSEKDDSTEKQNQARILGVTAGTLSHEISNPLMTILGTTELILNNGYKFDRETTQKIKMIERSARRIESTLRRLTRISVPAIRETTPGSLIDPRKSEILRKSRT